jgi:hypothetical protein
MNKGNAIYYASFSISGDDFSSAYIKAVFFPDVSEFLPAISSFRPRNKLELMLGRLSEIKKENLNFIIMVSFIKTRFFFVVLGLKIVRKFLSALVQVS